MLQVREAEAAVEVEVAIRNKVSRNRKKDRQMRVNEPVAHRSRALVLQRRMREQAVVEGVVAEGAEEARHCCYSADH